jgi:hypothetical protein
MRIEKSGVRIMSLMVAAAALGATAAILADTALANGATTDVVVFAGQPDTARIVTVKGNNAGSAGNVTVYGTNISGSPIQEVIALAGAAVVNGTKAFATITKITLPAYAVDNTERVRVGTGAKLGLPFCLTRNSVIAAFLANVKEAVAPTVTIDNDEVEKNLIQLNSALNGGAVIVDLYETQ